MIYFLPVETLSEALISQTFLVIQPGNLSLDESSQSHVQERLIKYQSSLQISPKVNTDERYFNLLLKLNMETFLQYVINFYQLILKLSYFSLFRMHRFHPKICMSTMLKLSPLAQIA